MRSDHTHKVCFEAAGVPIILRVLRSYQQCGVSHQIVVVGALGEQVQRTVSARFPNVSFAYQPEPLGTGHATRCGARVLEDLGYDGLVFVGVGDRIVAPYSLRRLQARLQETGSDVAFLVGRVKDNPSSGRVVVDGEGNVAGIVESSEIALSRLVGELEALAPAGVPQVGAAQVLARVRAHFADEHKARRVVGELHGLAASSETIPAEVLREHLAPLAAKTSLTLWLEGAPRLVRAAELEASADQANLSTYLFRAPALYEALAALTRDNAQGEEFITDCIQYLASQRNQDGTPRFRLTTVAVEQPDDSLAFNTPEELAEIERKLRLERPEAAAGGEVPALAGLLRPAAEWWRVFDGNAPEVQAFMSRTYGNVPRLHQEKRREYLTALGSFIEAYGEERPALIVRSPGRVNLLGRHVDHRGGNTNVIAISDEILMVAAPRDDDWIMLRNTQGHLFESAEFSLSQDIARLDWADWMTCINSPKTLSMVSNGNWSNYVRAAALRLQEQFRRHPLRGADIMTHGTIPVGSGLSSSSAVVVGAAEILVAANELPVRPNILVDLCGEGEWFVGTRGGAADHAAIKFGRLGAVAHVGFFPFEVLEFVPFLPEHSVVVCNSGVQARKSEGARKVFNQKVLGYVVGEIIIKQLLPDFALSIHHLRDMTCENLGLELEELYATLQQVPARLTQAELFRDWGPFAAADSRKLTNLLATLEDDGEALEVRGVVLYGLAEMERSRRCVDVLLRGDAQGLGRLWALSHDGDRVTGHDADLQPRPWEYEVTDAYLEGLKADLRSGDPARQGRAQLHRQPGKYACSTPELDLIVDLAGRQPGVRGAQLAGAGLGGSALILVHESGCEGLIAALGERGFAAKPYYTVEGAGVVRV
jgi:N-acetylgalactosamine kinase